MNELSIKGMRRVFIVGCSRSGTTLLQSLIASHPQVATFPETRYFWETLQKAPRRRYLVKFGLATGRESHNLRKMLIRFGREDLLGMVPEQPWRFHTAVRHYISLLDYLAEEDGGEIWVEKTPFHIRHIDHIEPHVPNSVFVHIVRDGREVVASIVDRAQKHPDKFRNQDIRYGIRLWNECIRKTADHASKPNHYVQCYEDIIEDVDACMKKIGSFVGVEYKAEMLQNRSDVFDTYPTAKEWVAKVNRPIESYPSKFYQLFSPQKQKRIQNNLNLNIMENLFQQKYHLP